MARLRGGDEAAPRPRPRGHPGVVAPCLDVVRFDPSYEKVVRFLLGDALIVRDLPARSRSGRSRAAAARS